MCLHLTYRSVTKVRKKTRREILHKFYASNELYVKSAKLSGLRSKGLFNMLLHLTDTSNLKVKLNIRVTKNRLSKAEIFNLTLLEYQTNAIIVFRCA